MVLQSTLVWFSDIMASFPEPMVPTYTLCLQALTEIILSPHNFFMACLLPGNFSTTDIPESATCYCTREGGQGLDWQFSEPPAACPGSASGRRMDGAEIPGFN